MVRITAEQLSMAVGLGLDKANPWVALIQETADRYQINTNLRLAAFLAQVAHESMCFKRLEENLYYSAKGLLATFPKHFNAEQAKQYERMPHLIAARAYANRMGNGDEASMDGWKYRGRGLIQITGKENYARCGKELGLLLLDEPDLLCVAKYAALSAGWFWKTAGLNGLADQAKLGAITIKINGGENGLAERIELYHQAKSALGVA